MRGNRTVSVIFAACRTYWIGFVFWNVDFDNAIRVDGILFRNGVYLHGERCRYGVTDCPVGFLWLDDAACGVRRCDKAACNARISPARHDAIEHVLCFQLAFEHDVDLVRNAVALDVYHFCVIDRNWAADERYWYRRLATSWINRIETLVGNGISAGRSCASQGSDGY